MDSEHSAIFQCLQGSACPRGGQAPDPHRLRRPFLRPHQGAAGRHVTPDQALKHPNWTMGAKITVDSATLMNKGLEFIEAMRLYRMPPEKISDCGPPGEHHPLPGGIL